MSKTSFAYDITSIKLNSSVKNIKSINVYNDNYKKHDDDKLYIIR